VKDATGTVVWSTIVFGEKGYSDDKQQAEDATDGVLVANWPTSVGTAGGEYTIHASLAHGGAQFKS